MRYESYDPPSGGLPIRPIRPTHDQRTRPMKLLFLILALLPTAALAQKPKDHTCRILFLSGPDSAPDKIHLFDGASSIEVDLPRMNFSQVYKLRPGALRLHLLPSPLDDPEKLPSGAPAATLAENITDFYLLVTSDPTNPVVPMRMQIINAGANKLKRGQMLWFNLTKKAVAGSVGSEKLVIKPASRLTLDPPARGNKDYRVNLFFRFPDSELNHPLCETQWRHDPRSRTVAFIINEPGARAPRILVFPDYREKEKSKE